LFGAARVPPEGSSLALTSILEDGDRIVALQLPMPFTESARWTFHNAGPSALSFNWRVRGDQKPKLPDEGYLHVQRREIVGPTMAPEYVAVEASGRGRLVGLCANIQGHADPQDGVLSNQLNFLEGDVRAEIDGELALDGTGTEEYADDVSYFSDSPHANAFTQTWGIVDQADPPGMASFCRWHVLGTELDFQSSLKLTFELGGSGDPTLMDRYVTVAFLYQPD
jgi:hypothetical protein